MCSQRDERASVAVRHYKLTVDYLLMKVEQRDWHGVADAAMDIRDIVAAHPDLERSL